MCLQHTSSFISERTALYSSFPHIYEICYDACNLFLPSLLSVYSTESRSSRPSSSPDFDNSSLETSRSNDLQPDTRPSELIRRSQKRSRRLNHPSQRVRVENVAKEVKPDPGLSPLNIRSIIQDIEDSYFSPRESAFWHFYKNVNCQPFFLDVSPCAVSSRHTYGTSKKGVIWEYQNDDVLLYTDSLGITPWVNRDNLRLVR